MPGVILSVLHALKFKSSQPGKIVILQMQKLSHRVINWTEVSEPLCNKTCIFNPLWQCISDSPQHFFHINTCLFLSCLLAMCPVFAKEEGSVWDGLMKKPEGGGHALSICKQAAALTYALCGNLPCVCVSNIHADKVHPIPLHHSNR